MSVTTLPRGPRKRTIPAFRQIIKGTIYNTETASALIIDHDADSIEAQMGAQWTDNMRVLMVTTRGHYFLFTCLDEGLCDPWEMYKITPLTRKAAIDWAAEQRGPHDVEEIFGRLPEPGEREPYNTIDP